jgi:hypothetical protein
VGVNAVKVRTKNGLQGEVKMMYKKDKGLCSPTSALQKKQMRSEELRNPD